MAKDWIELGLSRVDGAAAGAPHGEASAADPLPVTSAAPALIVDLLAVIGEMAPECTGIDTEQFRRELGRFASRIGASHDGVTAALAAECVRYCWAFLSEAREHLAERETEFADLIRILTEMVATLGGGSAFHDHLDRSADRLHRMVDINDIRILKRRLLVEIDTLKRLSSEQRARDDAHRSYFSTEIERLQVRLAQSMEEASLDQLTRIANRGRFERTLEQWLRAHRSSGHPFVLALVDVDGFKPVNDTYGHQEGDRVLVAIARTLQSAFRPTDLVARYGGDEFVVLLSHTTASHAQDRILEVMAHVAHIPVGEPPAAPGVLTLSVGVTEWAADDEAADLVERADAAMYDAKNAGKNRLEVRRRRSRSRLFQNGRPVVSVHEQPGIAEEAPPLLRRVR